jgi:hypothetical protein
MGTPNPENQERAKTGKDVAERVIQILTVIVALIGLPLAIAQGRPASVIVCATCVFAAIIVVTIRLWRARLPSERIKYQWQRWAAVATATAFVTALLVSSLIPTGRHFLIYSVLGFRSQVQTDVITIAESSHYYRVQIPVTNARPEDQQLANMTVTVSWGEKYPTTTCQAVPVAYRLDGRLRVTNGSSATGSVQVLAGGLAGFRLPVTGSFEDQCTSAKLVLSFMPGLSLQKNSTTLLYVDIPKHLQAYSDEYNAEISQAGQQQQSKQLSIGIPRLTAKSKVRTGYYIAVTSDSQTSSGDKVSGCEELDGGSSTGLRMTGCRRF